MVIITSEQRFQAVTHLLKLIRSQNQGNLQVLPQIQALSSKLALNPSDLHSETLELECQRWNANQRALEAIRTPGAYHGILFEGNQTSLQSLVLIGDAANIRKIEASLKLPVTGIRWLLFRNYSWKYLSRDCRRYFSLNRCLKIAVSQAAIPWVYDFLAEGAEVEAATLRAAARIGHLGLLQFLADQELPGRSMGMITPNSPLAAVIRANQLPVIKYWVETFGQKLLPCHWLLASLRDDPMMMTYIEAQMLPTIPTVEDISQYWINIIIEYGHLDRIRQCFEQNWIPPSDHPDNLLGFAFRSGRPEVVAEVLNWVGIESLTFGPVSHAIDGGHLALFQQYEAQITPDYDICLDLAAGKGFWDGVLYFQGRGGVPSTEGIARVRTKGYLDIAAYLRGLLPEGPEDDPDLMAPPEFAPAEFQVLAVLPPEFA